MQLCNQPMPLAKNGSPRGFCTRPHGHTPTPRQWHLQYVQHCAHHRKRMCIGSDQRERNMP